MKKWPLILFLIFFAGGTISCSQIGANSSGVEENSSIANILKDPQKFKGKRLRVRGEFRGWKGACLSAPPVSRSDWMLQDDKYCIYVTGPVPGSLDPLKPHGEMIEVNVVIEVDGAGKPYLTNRSSR
ncbi:MAG: hypothetical protein C0614_10365 [Desulfuromonas sp.]|nr:MAG: hypothetical protein C0614_10365 [Desulfuromonas sp.]